MRSLSSRNSKSEAAGCQIIETLSTAFRLFASHLFRNIEYHFLRKADSSNRLANAGGYCHRVFVHDESRHETVERRILSFSDEMTPRVEWTWDNFLFSAALRFHCRTHCKCEYRTENDPNHPDETNVWEISPTSRFVRSTWGRITLESTGYPLLADGHPADEGDGQSSSGASTTYEDIILLVLPSQANGPISGTCGADKKQFCQEPWPEAILGPLPRSPIVYIPGVPRNPPENICKTGCTSPQQCIDQSSLRCPLLGPCAVNISTMTQKVTGSLGNVVTSFAISRCVRKHSRLNGRAEENQEILDWPCACNSTYVSHGCCHADNGLVWEAPHRFLGGLQI